MLFNLPMLMSVRSEVLVGRVAGFTGEYLDPFNRGQLSRSWNIKRLSGV